MAEYEIITATKNNKHKKFAKNKIIPQVDSNYAKTTFIYG